MVVDTKMLQSSFYPSFLSPGSALDGTAQSLPGLIPLPFHLEILYSRAAGVICLRDVLVCPAQKWKVDWNSSLQLCGIIIRWVAWVFFACARGHTCLSVSDQGGSNSFNGR